MCLMGVYSKSTLMGYIFIDAFVVLYFICFLSAHKRIMEGGDDVIFGSTLCRWSPTFSHNFYSCPFDRFIDPQVKLVV